MRVSKASPSTMKPARLSALNCGLAWKKYLGAGLASHSSSAS